MAARRNAHAQRPTPQNQDEKRPSATRRRAATFAAMPKPPEPADLKHCSSCGKVIGPHKGWFGPECQCGQEPGSALRGAHGAGTRAPNGGV
jgi:hypothetical protein